ncbi:MAG: hypothetical protein A2580_16435 [Hydrogenophilales bacterium RIFOXYD1_FULL_62_11]|nr:MAG: hypothetical protein A2580_16435 [Hydrogenophilales bacterium RIFOXYD1_FULL_62_11]
MVEDQAMLYAPVVEFHEPVTFELPWFQLKEYQLMVQLDISTVMVPVAASTMPLMVGPPAAGEPP